MSDRFQPRRGTQPRLRERNPARDERLAATIERSVAAQQARAATRSKKRTSRRRWIFRAALLAAVLVAVALVVPQTGNILRSLANANPDLMRIGPIADAVGATIGDRPDTPAGTDPTG